MHIAGLTSMENIPFKVGQLAELRSFCSGYRGAWFRCKIREITKRKGILHHLLEYYDYPDEKLRWTKLYQIPLHGKGNTKEKRRELILRPQYPTLYNEKQMPHVSEISEVIVIVCDSWKVGDLVDWMNSGCLWCGRISQVFDDQEAQIELRPPPHGEGLSYRVLLKDLRPSLDWSTAHGWTLPTQEDGTGHPCARLIKPINQGYSSSTPSRCGEDTYRHPLARLHSSNRFHASSSTRDEDYSFHYVWCMWRTGS
ncbi:uncharacterized protein LOC131021390 isoform X5 [Salvia miltiorrhiza]|uniref:uncharacterized protein LOC131021390 isoform X5 n=1 Tax=Salvia miltiorrhiza TaxID=226208 RepID=UPI0025AC7B7D|nr:uncharacterized protein LOC131021390 isoform X5 [Salvia miltiorrhiza]